MRARTQERQCISTDMQRSAQHRECMSATSRVASLMAGDQDGMKLRLLSRTWPNISKLEHAVLILRPSMFIAAVVKRLVPASLNAWRHRTASVQKGADGWKWPKPEHWKNKKPRNKKNNFQRVLLGTPPSTEPRNMFVFCFYKVFSKCGALQGNWHESPAKLSKCLWEWGVQ